LPKPSRARSTSPRPGWEPPFIWPESNCDRQPGSILFTCLIAVVGPAITDLIGGQVQTTFATVAAIGQQIRQGLVRALAVTGDGRVAQLPDVPTMAEAGLPAVDATPIFGLVGPASLPPPIIDKLAEVAGKALKSEALRVRITGLGFFSVGSSPSEFMARIDDEIAKWTRIVEKGNIQPG
jgi:tripartite-type tricarboxylate transporter receptor subunit TctC